MWKSRALYFGLGVATPFILRSLRPVAKMAIRGGLKAAGCAQRLVAEAREGIEDLAAEAESEAEEAMAPEVDVEVNEAPAAT